MHILMLNYEYPPLGGGAGNATKYILREFSDLKDLKIDLVTSSTSGFNIVDFSGNITIHRLDIKKKGSLHYQSASDVLKYVWKAYWYCRVLAKVRQYDMIHAFFGIPCGFIAMLLTLPYIVSLRGSDVPFYNKRFEKLDSLIFKRLSKIVWRRSEAVVALSNDLRNLARETCGQCDISVIYNGIDTEEFYPDVQILNNESTLNILFVGRLIGRKGLIYLLMAFKKLLRKFPKIKLHIAGDGPLKEGFLRYINENGLENSIEFYGIVDHDSIFKLYQKSHIFVLPSLNEALGNVTHEALASGLPIVTTRTGAAELIDGNGFVIEKESSDDIVKCIEKLLIDTKLRSYMSAKSRQIAKTMTWRKVAESYLEIYKKVSQ